MHTLSSGSPTTSSTRRLARVATTATALAVVLAACGSDGDDAASGAVSGEISESPLTLTAVDYAYQGVPEQVRAGAEITLANDSDVEVHEVVAIRLPDDEDRPVSEIVTLPPEELATFFPFVETVVVAPPGAPSGMVVEGSGVLDEPGRYALICVIPTGADPDEYLAAAAAAEGGPPQVDGGPPHIVEGMFAEVTVVE